MEKAIEILLHTYFREVFQIVTDPLLSKNIVDMEDELNSLTSIFPDIVEEKVKHKHWIFHLELPYLAEWYFAGQAEKPKNITKHQKPQSSKAVCRYFVFGKCKYEARCRFQHIRDSDLVKENSISDNDSRSKAKFDLEIRFPDGNYSVIIEIFEEWGFINGYELFSECKYPADIPLILLVPQHREFSSHICLRITHYLLQKARICASQGMAYCYNLIDCLMVDSESILKWLSKLYFSRSFLPIIYVFQFHAKLNTFR